MNSLEADKPIISKDVALELLARLEKIRRKIEKRGSCRGSEDFYIRVVTAVVADAGGFKTRKEWEDILCME